MSIDSATLQASVRRLFPNLEPEEAIAELLLERARKNLIKYRTVARQFESRYGQDFATFRQTILDSDPPFETEQDYFDWELSVAGIEDMEEEIECLRHLIASS